MMTTNYKAGVPGLPGFSTDGAGGFHIDGDLTVGDIRVGADRLAGADVEWSGNRAIGAGATVNLHALSGWNNNFTGGNLVNAAGNELTLPVGFYITVAYLTVTCTTGGNVYVGVSRVSDNAILIGTDSPPVTIGDISVVCPLALNSISPAVLASLSVRSDGGFVGSVTDIEFVIARVA